MHVVHALLMNCTSLYRVQRSVFFSKFLVSKQNLELGDTYAFELWGYCRFILNFLMLTYVSSVLS